MNKSKAEKIELLVKLLLLSCAVLLSIKYIFVDFGVDVAFQTTMSYRLATGDLMFKQMWEPYQMSAFLCAFFIKIFLLIFKSTTGIVIYLQTIGVIIDGIVAILLYKTLKKTTGNKWIPFVAALFLFVVSPKDVPIAEYTNMLVWFSTLVLICLIKYFDKEKLIYLILCGISMCAVVLSYPSTVLVYVAVMAYLLFRKKYKAVLVITLTCSVIGTAYLIFVFTTCPISEFTEVLHNMFALETSHSETTISKLSRYAKELVLIFMLNALSYIVALACVGPFKKKLLAKDVNLFYVANVLYVFVVMCASLYMAICWKKYVRFNFYNYMVPIIAVGVFSHKELRQEEKSFYIIGLIIGIADFISGLLLTNLRLVDTLPLVMVAVIASLIPFGRMVMNVVNKAEIGKFLLVICVLCIIALMFRNLYIIRPINGDISTITHIAGITKVGPDKGIISEYMGPYMQNESFAEWQQYIHEGDAIFLIGGSLDNIGYLYKKVEISAPSTVPTPDYNESLLKYWEQNPEKYPNVIIASCWYGEMNSDLTEDSFIMRWIEEEYKPSNIIDGKYWRYYFK